MIVRKQVEALHALGPNWLALFLADLGDITGCQQDILDLLAAYADVSKGYVRGRR